MTKPKTPHLVTVDLTPEVVRELHLSALADLKQAIERVLPALGLRSPLLRAGVWRLVDVPTCPACGVTAPVDRPDLVPWVFRSQRVVCDGGCEFNVRELIDLFCKTNAEVDGLLAKIQVGRPKLTRFYIFELRLNEPVNNEEPKWRRVIGTDMIATLARLEPAGDSVIRAVAVDAADLMVAQSIVRSDREIPWCPRLPIDYRGQLLAVDWHGAPLSFAERQLMRRRRAS